MAPPPTSPQLLEAAAEAVRAHGTVAAAADALGLSRSTLRNRYLAAKRRGIADGSEVDRRKARGGRTPTPGGSRPRPGLSAEYAVDAGLVTYTAPQVLTVEDALEKGGVDLETWEVERHTLNSWEVGSKDTRESGDGGGAMVVTPLWQVKVWLRRRHPLDQRHAARLVLEELRDAARPRNTRARAPARPRGKGERFCYEISVPDLHVGKLAWAPEAGDNYDAQIARGVYTHTVGRLLERVDGLPVERFWLPVGNDLLHVDTGANTTTAGTRQDVDGRWQRSFSLAWRMLAGTIELLASRAPVYVPVIPGNHDRERAWMLGELLAARFEGHKAVEIDNAPSLRKYAAYGPALVMWAHGDGLREQEVEGLMARERPELFAAATHREGHGGHFHKRKRRDFIGADTWGSVVWRVLPSLSGTDAWHAQMGYVNGPRAAEAYLWSNTEGYAGHFSAGPPAGAYS